MRGDENAMQFSLDVDPALLMMEGITPGGALNTVTIFVANQTQTGKGRIDMLLAPGSLIVRKQLLA
jgi:hypothetical protein